MYADNIFLPNGAKESSKISIRENILTVTHKGEEAKVHLDRTDNVSVAWGRLESTGYLNVNGEFPKECDPSKLVAAVYLTGGFGFRLWGDGRFKGIGMTLIHAEPLFLSPTWPPVEPNND